MLSSYLSKSFAWARCWAVNAMEPSWQDIIEANRQIGYGVDETDLKIMESIDQLKSERWKEFHAKYG